MAFGSTGNCLAMVKCNGQYEIFSLLILLFWSFANIILAETLINIHQA
jgi:hypothetical protein